MVDKHFIHELFLKDYARARKIVYSILLDQYLDENDT